MFRSSGPRETFRPSDRRRNVSTHSLLKALRLACGAIGQGLAVSEDVFGYLTTLTEEPAVRPDTSTYFQTSIVLRRRTQ